MYSFLHPLVTSSLSDPNVLISTLFSNTLSRCSTLISETNFRACKITGKIIALMVCREWKAKFLLQPKVCLGLTYSKMRESVVEEDFWGKVYSSWHLRRIGVTSKVLLLAPYNVSLSFLTTSNIAIGHITLLLRMYGPRVEISVRRHAAQAEVFRNSPHSLHTQFLH